MTPKPSYIFRHPKTSIVIFFVTCLLVGGFVGWRLASYAANKYIASQFERPIRLQDKAYPLINSLLLCNIDSKNFNEDKKMESTIKNFIATRISQGSIENMSVYMINYNTGLWSGVNQNDQYDPASMLKVPIMMAYYKEAEDTPGILSTEISFNGDDQNTGEYFKSPNDIQSGKVYTVENLMQSMIINSDNTAALLLQNYIDKNTLFEVFTDLGLPIPNNGSNVEYMSAKSYASFFRLLYNATYLNTEYSEKALNLLTQSTPIGIKVGVPQGVVVAQKFGERSVDDASGNLTDRELHDCGIIYKTGSPYLLCVMSRGKNFDALNKNISDLSALIYQKIDTN